MASDSGPGIEISIPTPDDLSTPISEQKPALQKTPDFIRKYSKQHSQPERDELARSIREKRTAYFSGQTDLAEQDAALAEKFPKTEEALLEGEVRLAHTTETIASLSPSWYIEALNFMALNKLNQEYSRSARVVDGLRKTHEQMLAEEKTVKEQLGDNTELDEAKAMLDAFYRGEKRKWQDAPFTPEELGEVFKPENLATLSTEEYILLMRRFPSEMVTHVTRQGVRDHAVGMDHTAGIGEHQNGFVDMLADGEMKSFLGIYLKEGVTRTGIKKLMTRLSGKFGKDEDARIILEQLSTEGEGEIVEKWADRTSVHFAAEEVADDLYGSERGNEIFITFPSALIASQYFFSGKLTDGTSGNKNDSWIWTKDQEGIPIDAGLVFIPEDTQVDSESGSKYKLDADRKPVEIAENINNVIAVLESPAFKEISDRIFTALGYDIHSDKTAQIAEIKSFMAENGFTDPIVQEAFLNRSRLSNVKSLLNHGEYDGDEGDREQMRDKYRVEAAKYALMDSGHLYELAENPVTSGEYWNRYFEQHPDQAPKHLVYYRGGDPTRALLQWREDNGLTKKTDDPHYGFEDEGSIKDFADPRIAGQREKFSKLAKQVLIQTAA